MGIDGVGLPGLPRAAERGEHGAVRAEARGDAVLVPHGGHEVEGLVSGRGVGGIGGGDAGERGDGGLGGGGPGAEHVGEDAAGGGGGVGERVGVGGGEEVEELVVLVGEERGASGPERAESKAAMAAARRHGGCSR